ncbi:ATP-binding protein [Patescibacteria group bacterium]|nr:ATP-binding protein [Patescibacteria group bacterium]
MGLFNLKKTKKEEAAATTAPTTAPTTEQGQGVRPFVEGLVSTKDIIAPTALEVDFDFIRIDNKYYRTLFVAGYPRFVNINWLSTLINFDASLSISMYVYPTDGKEILDDLRRKIAEMEAELTTDIQRGKIVNPATQAKLEDALNLQADLVKGEERFFQFGLYITVSAYTKEEVNRITKNLESALGALMIISKKATLQMEEGFATTLPICSDRLKITRNMDTTSLATTFPFVSSDLSDDKGVMFGINEHNGSLVIFDRFSMQNYNSVVFATAGAGKSYMIKLEALRSLMLGTEIIVIDPENEYRDLAEAVGGQYIAFGYGEASKINPFDLSLVEEEGENALNSKILALHKLFKVMIGSMDPMEESILDRAIMDAYKQKGITPDPESQKREPPLVEDLYKSLMGMEDPKAQMLVARFEKYIKGSFAGIFNQKTTVNLDSNFVVFGIRNLEETLRPVAMHIILDYIWTIVKRELKKRILVVDEAWYMMQYEDSASFLRGIVKRGRKYYLGVTTITQDVDDFLETAYGKEIVTNSSIQILLKQHSAAIDKVGEVFYLSEGEKQLLLSAEKGEGIFFAGQNHVAIRVVASPDEHKLITSNPEEIMKLKQAKQGLASKTTPTNPPPTPVAPTAPAISTTPTQPQQPAAAPNEKMEVKTVSEPQKLTVAPTEAPVPAVIPKEKTEANQRFEAPKVEVVEAPEAALKKRIEAMEAQEKEALKAHEEKQKVEQEQKKKEEETKKKLNGTFSTFNSLPKYADLFKSNETPKAVKLPPLPPLPALPKTPQTTGTLKLSPPASTAGGVKSTTSSTVLSKPIPPIINKVNPQPMPVSQPPQNKPLADSKNPLREVKVEVATETKTQTPAAAANIASNTPKTPQTPQKNSYDELFGQGII